MVKLTNLEKSQKSGLQSCNLSHVMYGVATISRFLKIIGLFCKRAL